MLALLVALALDAPSWDRDIRPLFERHCNGCHAATVTMGSLDLENYAGVLKGGNHGTIVVKGKPRESRLYTMLTGEASPAMPMDGKVLAPQQIAMVAGWIAAGAAGPAKDQFYSLAWHPSGEFVALGAFKKVRFSNNAPELTGFADAVRAIAYSKDGKLLAAAGGLPGRKGEVVIREGDTVRATITGHSDCIYAIAFSPDGKMIATASYDKLIKLWDTATGKEIRTLKDHIDAVYALAFTPDGSRLVSGAADRTVKLWNPATGERLHTMGEATDGVNTVAVSPDGKRVAAGGLDKSLRLWSVSEKSAEQLVSQIAHEDGILKIAFTPDGKRLISTAADRTIKLFDAADFTELRSLPRQSDWVSGLEVSPDGKRLAVARLDGTYQIIPLEDSPR